LRALLQLACRAKTQRFSAKFNQGLDTRCSLSGKPCLNIGQIFDQCYQLGIVPFLTFAIPSEIRIIRPVIALPAPLLTR
jgi:hypothetical protein